MQNEVREHLSILYQEELANLIPFLLKKLFLILSQNFQFFI